MSVRVGDSGVQIEKYRERDNVVFDFLVAAGDTDKSIEGFRLTDHAACN
jgi:hypothetical protein